jgi:hypothetical protein
MSMIGFRELDKCIFCGDSDMTEEHLIAAWVLRAFHRQRKPDPGFSGGFVGPNQMRLSTEEPISTAKVICRSCNNEWLSVIDNAAADVLKPLIRGDDTVTLDGDGQAVFAAWIYKCALIFDAAENGNDGDLVPLREGFEASREAGPGCVIYAGPAPPMPFSVPGIPEVAGLRMFGIRPISGTLNLTVNVQNADGTVSPDAPTSIPIPGYQVMLGGLCAYLGGRVSPITPESLEGFAQIWPASPEPAVVSPALRGEP